jgi:hypothetical protein
MGKLYFLKTTQRVHSMTRPKVIDFIVKNGISPIKQILDENRRVLAHWDMILLWKEVKAKEKQNQDKSV